MIKRKATICDLLVKFNSKNTKVCASTEKKGKVNPCKWEVINNVQLQNAIQMTTKNIRI